jgi:hypothetical protein
MKLVLSGWRATVARLVSSGQPLTDIMRKIMDNCLPSMAWVTSSTTVCCNSRFCPWCYARRFISVLKKLGVDEPSVRDAWGEGIRCRYLNAFEYLTIHTPIQTLREELFRRFDRIHSFLKDNLQTIRGAAYAIDPYPELDSAGKQVLCVRTGVLLLDIDGSVPVNSSEGCVLSPVKLSEVSEIYTSVASYPATLLTAQPDQLLLLAKAWYRLRLRYRCGLLYDKDE